MAAWVALGLGERGFLACEAPKLDGKSLFGI
jgi:hypothetical protein